MNYQPPSLTDAKYARGMTPASLAALKREGKWISANLDALNLSYSTYCADAGIGPSERAFGLFASLQYMLLNRAKR